jgi:MoaA/NifB/PqqE/SkfB family radical SAM enzyme
MNYLIKPASEYLFPESTLNKYGCYRISKYIEIHISGDISICCFTWLPKFVGNILTDSPKEILNNIERLSLISDMDQGKFTECNDHCPYINSILNGKNPDGYIVPLSELSEYKKKIPLAINFSYDPSCNLQCPSCRNELIMYSLGENETLDKVHTGVQNLIDYLLLNDEKLLLNITGSGDAFASPIYWDYLKKLKPHKNLLLKLSTNGILMTTKKLNEIQQLWDNIYQINVSIDAATEKTYNIVRKNGSLEKVKKNLQSLNKSIEKNQFRNLKVFLTIFTVQKLNYKEVKEFAQWQLTYSHLTSIYFNFVVQWGHINSIRFENDFDLTTTEKQELYQILQDSVFDDPKIILGNLNSIKYEQKN